MVISMHSPSDNDEAAHSVYTETESRIRRFAVDRQLTPLGATWTAQPMRTTAGDS